MNAKSCEVLWGLMLDSFCIQGTSRLPYQNFRDGPLLLLRRHAAARMK